MPQKRSHITPNEGIKYLTVLKSFITRYIKFVRLTTSIDLSTCTKVCTRENHEKVNNVFHVYAKNNRGNDVVYRFAALNNQLMVDWVRAIANSMNLVDKSENSARCSQRMNLALGQGSLYSRCMEVQQRVRTEPVDEDYTYFDPDNEAPPHPYVNLQNDRDYMQLWSGRNGGAERHAVAPVQYNPYNNSQEDYLDMDKSNDSLPLPKKIGNVVNAESFESAEEKGAGLYYAEVKKVIDESPSNKTSKTKQEEEPSTEYQQVDFDSTQALDMVYRSTFPPEERILTH
ncbi:hypothetical protein Ciccas_006083 [Cichlidogyrus casuarinus]|uniref:PH domain-containing protein n=1 Tax=Cichlidogyrus casuarinus TaxID=1844966 RepID=A0ABD2Q980_9PLAT